MASPCAWLSSPLYPDRFGHSEGKDAIPPRP